MKVIPPYINTITSNAERKIFELFTNSNDLGDWSCLHSFGLSSHISKREGEIDFLLVGKDGVFVLEVKGGRVSRKDGLWFFTDRYGRTTQKRESPFTQAKLSLYSIRNELISHFGDSVKDLVYGYGVVFPDIIFSSDSPEWSQEIVFDSRDLDIPIAKYVDRLSGYWTGRQHTSSQPDSDMINKITNYLRGDFEAIPSLDLSISDSETEILKLTTEQYTALDAMEENPRTIFSGPAGTGKTLLALEKARRNQFRGISTIFLCFNRLLGLYLSDMIKKEKLDLIKVNSLHQFFYETISQKGHGSKMFNFGDQRSLFSKAYPEKFSELWPTDKYYRELIVDEGQDVLTPEYIDALDRIIDGGFENGRWTLFVDSEIQKNMYSSFDRDIYEKLKGYASIYQLTVNCRNTKPIAIQTEVVTGFPLGRIKKVQGLPVKYLWYLSPVDQAHKVSASINDILKEGIKAEEIAILSPKRYQDSLAGSGRLRVVTGHYELGKKRRGESGGLIGCGTVHSYKGLENSVIVLTDIDDISSEESKIVNYVGFTRPRAMLIVAINSRLKDQYEKYFSETVGRQVK